MSLTIEIVDAMVESGCTAEQIAAVTKAHLKKEQERIDGRRAYEREKKRKQRLNKGLSPDVPGTLRDSRDIDLKEKRTKKEKPPLQKKNPPIGGQKEKVSPAEACDEGLAVEAWNSMADKLGLSRVQKLTKTRKSKLRARLRECDGIEGWRIALEKVRGSPFLSGEKSDWKANFDFLLQESSFTKIMEGVYDRNEKQQTGFSGDRGSAYGNLAAGISQADTR